MNCCEDEKLCERAKHAELEPGMTVGEYTLIEPKTCRGAFNCRCNKHCNGIEWITLNGCDEIRHVCDITLCKMLVQGG